MQAHLVGPTKDFHTTSFMYTNDRFQSSLIEPNHKEAYVSPKDYQKNRSHLLLPSQKKPKRKVTKKIILGKSCNGKQKMNLQELQALSRQISFGPRHNDILCLSRNLRENLFRAKSKMMDNLKHSNEPQDIRIYNDLIKREEETDDDCDSVNQIKLVTNASGSVSVVSSSDDYLSSSSASTTSSLDDEQDDLSMPLYTPNYYSSSIMDMDLFLQHPWPLLEKTPYNDHEDVTEDQINSWLQRGGHDDNSIMSPITMATDQELADLLDFDDM